MRIMFAWHQQKRRETDGRLWQLSSLVIWCHLTLLGGAVLASEGWYGIDGAGGEHQQRSRSDDQRAAGEAAGTGLTLQVGAESRHQGLVGVAACPPQLRHRAAAPRLC